VKRQFLKAHTTTTREATVKSSLEGISKLSSSQPERSSRWMEMEEESKSAPCELNKKLHSEACERLRRAMEVAAS